RLLKRTPLGPLGMGACRFLNVLLGMSAASVAWEPAHWMIAGGLGVYIVGVTWFARKEAGESSSAELIASVVVMGLGVGMLIWFPAWADSLADPLSRPVASRIDLWRMLLLILAFVVGRRCVTAILRPEPAQVQAAVKQCIMTLVLLDASVVLVVRDAYWAVAVACLLIPAVLLGRWVYST
ncbi:MAG: hypothetical protein N2C14_10935, partial [Planctomycetales bacterium]